MSSDTDGNVKMFLYVALCRMVNGHTRYNIEPCVKRVRACEEKGEGRMEVEEIDMYEIKRCRKE